MLAQKGSHHNFHTTGKKTYNLHENTAKNQSTDIIPTGHMRSSMKQSHATQNLQFIQFYYTVM